MSWSMTLTTSEPVTEEQFDAVCEALPDDMKGPHAASKQVWGWSLQVDVWQDDPKHIRVGGAGFSRELADSFGKEFAKRLGEACACRVRRGKISE